MSVTIHGAEILEPQEGWQHFGCPECGAVHTLPAERAEEAPWCAHNGNYMWRRPHPAIKDFVQMVRVEVIVA